MLETSLFKVPFSGGVVGRQQQVLYAKSIEFLKMLFVCIAVKIIVILTSLKFFSQKITSLDANNNLVTSWITSSLFSISSAS